MFRATALLLVFLSACARHVPRPILASDVAEAKRGPAVSAYLAQRDANATVCDLQARGPHIAAMTAKVRDDLMKGLSDGRIPPDLWRQCVDAVTRSADRETIAALFDAVRVALAKHRLDSVASRYATAYVAAMEPIRGLLNGAPIDTATLDALFRAADDSTLRQYADRLPDSSLRAEAKRRAIRLRIGQSPYSLVRDSAASIEQTLMNTGVNRVDMDDHPLVLGWIDDPVRTARVVLVRQDVEHRTATLVGSYEDDSVVSVLPQLSLRGALHLQLQGIEPPVTLCGPPQALDPSPCVGATEVRLGNPMAYLEADGTIRFVERITAGNGFRLGAQQERFVVPVIVHGQQLAALDWALRFVTPNEFVFGGSDDLQIRMDVLAANRLGYTVTHRSRQYTAIVERQHWRDFDVLSQGSAGSSGMDGSSGSDGSSGQSGTNASCPSSSGGNGGRGEDGGAGGDGSPGGDGGDGGNVLVEIHATGAQAEELRALVHWTVASRGGRGGSGGAGGRGGRGGSGGAGGTGTTCFDTEGHATYLPGGSSGMSGSDGRSGLVGSSGHDGRDGVVTVRVVP